MEHQNNNPTQPAQNQPKNQQQYEDTFSLKKIHLGKQPLPIVLQDKNGPCPLISIVNALLLRGTPFPLLNSRIEEGILVARLSELVSWLANIIIEKTQSLNVKNSSKSGATPGNNPQEASSSSNAMQIDTEDIFSESNKESNLQSALLMLPQLNEGLQINPMFKNCFSFEFTEELSVFDILGIELIHGWISDPNEKISHEILNNLSYNSAAEAPINKIYLQEQLEKLSIQMSQQNLNPGDFQNLGLEAAKIEKQILQIEIVEEFLKTTSSSQMTHYGLSTLRKTLKNNRVYVLFRHNHFSVLVKYKDELYVLCSDIAFGAYPDVVFQQICDLQGKETVFVNGFFLPVAMESEEDSKKILEKMEKEEKEKKEKQEKEDYLFALSLMKQEEQAQQQQQNSSRSSPHGVNNNNNNNQAHSQSNGNLFDFSDSPKPKISKNISNNSQNLNKDEKMNEMLQNLSSNNNLSNFLNYQKVTSTVAPEKQPSTSFSNKNPEKTNEKSYLNDPTKRLQKSSESLKELNALRMQRQHEQIKELGLNNYKKTVKQKEKEIEEARRKMFEEDPNSDKSGNCLIS